jgi:hypothetical protein
MSKKQTRKKKARAFWAMNAAGFRAIGRFTFELSQLEFSIRAVLAGHLELPAKYFDIVTAPYDFAMLCKVFREVVGADKSNAQKKQLERWCDACLALKYGESADRTRDVDARFRRPERTGRITQHAEAKKLLRNAGRDRQAKRRGGAPQGTDDRRQRAFRRSLGLADRSESRVAWMGSVTLAM